MKQTKSLFILLASVAISTSAMCWLFLFLFMFFNNPVQSDPVPDGGIVYAGLIVSLVGVIYSWVVGVPLYLLASRVTFITAFKAAGLGFLSVLPLLLIHNIKVVMILAIIAVPSALLASVLLKFNMRLLCSDEIQDV